MLPCKEEREINPELSEMKYISSSYATMHENEVVSQ